MIEKINLHHRGAWKVLRYIERPNRSPYGKRFCIFVTHTHIHAHPIRTATRGRFERREKKLKSFHSTSPQPTLSEDPLDIMISPSTVEATTSPPAAVRPHTHTHTLAALNFHALFMYFLPALHSSVCYFSTFAGKIICTFCHVMYLHQAQKILFQIC